MEPSFDSLFVPDNAAMKVLEALLSLTPLAVCHLQEMKALIDLVCE